MKYIILPRCKANIRRFYLNVAKKYQHTYSRDLMYKNYHEAETAIYQIENGLIRRRPTKERWRKYYMANTKRWYFAYKIIGDTIFVVDACHAQNMH